MLAQLERLNEEDSFLRAFCCLLCVMQAVTLDISCDDPTISLLFYSALSRACSRTVCAGGSWHKVIWQGLDILHSRLNTLFIEK